MATLRSAASGRHPGGPEGRHERGDHRHAEPEHDRGDHRGHVTLRWSGGQVGAAGLEGLRDPLGQARRPSNRPSTAAKRADEGGLQEDRAEHLALAGAEGAQQGQLAGALRHQDREGVRDDEDAHEQGHAAEHREDRLEEGEALLHVGGLLLGRGDAGEHLGALGQRPWLIAPHELGLRHARGRPTPAPAGSCRGCRPGARPRAG